MGISRFGGDGRLARLTIESQGLSLNSLALNLWVLWAEFIPPSSGRAIVHFKDERMLVARVIGIHWRTRPSSARRLGPPNEPASFSISEMIYYMEGWALDRNVKRCRGWKLPSALKRLAQRDDHRSRKSLAWGWPRFSQIRKAAELFLGSLTKFSPRNSPVRAFDVLDDILVAGDRRVNSTGKRFKRVVLTLIRY